MIGPAVQSNVVSRGPISKNASNPNPSPIRSGNDEWGREHAFYPYSGQKYRGMDTDVDTGFNPVSTGEKMPHRGRIIMRKAAEETIVSSRKAIGICENRPLRLEKKGLPCGKRTKNWTT